MRVVAVPDCHIPFENKRAFALACKVIGALKPDAVVILGDWCDAYSISRYTKSPERSTKLKKELTAGRAALITVRKLCPEIRFLEGNHELRLDKFIADRCPELFGLVNMRELLDLAPKEWQPYQQVFKIGKMSYVHDLGYSGANALHRTAQACGSNIVMGHIHSAGVHYTGTLDGERHVAIASGWLGDNRHIDYCSPAARQHWQHGVTLVDYDSRSNAFGQFVPFVNSKCVVQGREITL